MSTHLASARRGVSMLAVPCISIAFRFALAFLMAVAVCGCGGGSGGGGSANVGAAMDLYEIESGVGGFAIHGALFESVGQRVAVLGDVNGDGMDDVALGVPYSLLNQTIGGALVVFGKTDTAPVESADIFDGLGGFKIIGIDGDAGNALSAAGDVNGDGLADIVVGSRYGSLGGQAYVIYGKTTTTPVFLDAVIAGSGGFSVYGPAISGNFGSSVGAAGDFNGDGFDDVVVGDPYWRPDVLLFPQSGAACIVYGQSDSGDVGTRGAAGIRLIRGVDHQDFCGYVVSGAGDVNGDGFADVVVAAPSAGTPERPYAGESYVVFGDEGSLPILLADVSNGVGGFVIRGAFPLDGSGLALSSAGDVNGDTLADVIIGVPTSEVSGVYYSGAAYVVFGRTGTAPVDLLEIESGAEGFLIYGTRIFDQAGYSVSGAGDVNGDGFDDVIVGVPGQLFDSEQDGSGAAFVVYGKADSSPVGLDQVESGIGGFGMVGTRTYDRAGESVSGGGDINGDGFFDVVVGAPGVGPGDPGDAPGSTYVVFNPFSPDTAEVRIK